MYVVLPRPLLYHWQIAHCLIHMGFLSFNGWDSDKHFDMLWLFCHPTKNGSYVGSNIYKKKQNTACVYTSVKYKMTMIFSPYVFLR